MAVTLIDDVLDGLSLQGTVFSRMTLSGDWGFAKEELAGAPFHLILSGTAWCQLSDEPDGRRVGAGDLVILPRGDRHRLLAHPDVEPVSWRSVVDHMGWQHWQPGMRFKSVDFHFGDGPVATRLISGVLAFGDRRRNPLLSALPKMMVVRADEPTSTAKAVVATTALLEAEMLSGEAGAESVAGRLADILFIQAVRHYLNREAELPPGWLRAIADAEIGAAIGLMHSAPDRAWTVDGMARELGMSRSRFAARFRDVVGLGPLEYLTNWRMHRAATRLAGEKVSVAALATASGYRSEVAFSKAFKRWSGRSPVEYRRTFA